VPLNSDGDWLADYYELLVKEYLEKKGFMVTLNVKFLKNKRESDIDVLAIDPKKDSVIVGEVKDAQLSEKQIDHENSDFNDKNLKNKVKEITGHDNFSKVIYCWSVQDSVKKDAPSKYKIEIIEFWEIINYLIGKVQPEIQKNKWEYETAYPNTMLIQMLLDYEYLKSDKGKTKVDLKKPMADSSK
jgi:hypothetical protein